MIKDGIMQTVCLALIAGTCPIQSTLSFVLSHFYTTGLALPKENVAVENETKQTEHTYPLCTTGSARATVGTYESMWNFSICVEGFPKL